MKALQKITGCFLVFSFYAAAQAAGGPEENFEIRVPRSGAKVESPLPMSELKGTYVVVPYGGISHKTAFSISSKYDECPQLPKNLVDVAPPINFGPEDEKFLMKVTVRLAIPKTYPSRLAKKHARGHVANSHYELWKFGPHRNWTKVPLTHSAKNYVEFSTNIFDSHCYTVTNKL